MSPSFLQRNPALPIEAPIFSRTFSSYPSPKCQVSKITSQAKQAARVFHQLHQVGQPESSSLVSSKHPIDLAFSFQSTPITFKDYFAQNRSQPLALEMFSCSKLSCFKPYLWIQKKDFYGFLSARQSIPQQALSYPYSLKFLFSLLDFHFRKDYSSY